MYFLWIPQREDWFQSQVNLKTSYFDTLSAEMTERQETQGSLSFFEDVSPCVPNDPMIQMRGVHAYSRHT